MTESTTSTTTTTTTTKASSTMTNYQEFSHILRSNLFPSVGGEWRTSTGSTYIDPRDDINASDELAHDTTHCRHKDWLGM